MTDVLRELEDLEAKATSGDWAWFDDHRAASPYLATVDRGRIYVMGFARRGMSAAQPVFQVREDDERPGGGRMRTAAEIGPDWRKHPDAALIVAARNALPALLRVAEAARAALEQAGPGGSMNIDHRATGARAALRAALDDLTGADR